MGLETILGTALGAAGLLQNHEQGRRQQNAMGDANALNWDALNFQKDIFNRYSSPALQHLVGLAGAYDPVAESRAATDYAQNVAGDTISKALHGFNASYAAGGGIPGNSSIEGAQKAAVIKPIAQQLAGIVAEAAGNATAKKAQMWQSVLGAAPAGGLSNAYFGAADNLARNAASMPGGDFGGSSRLLAEMLNQIFAKKGGAGGSGDNRYGPVNIASSYE